MSLLPFLTKQVYDSAGHQIGQVEISVYEAFPPPWIWWGGERFSFNVGKDRYEKLELVERKQKMSDLEVDLEQLLEDFRDLVFSNRQEVFEQRLEKARRAYKELREKI